MLLLLCDHDVLCGSCDGAGVDAIMYGVWTLVFPAEGDEKSVGGAGMSIRMLDRVDDRVDDRESSLDEAASATGDDEDIVVCCVCFVGFAMLPRMRSPEELYRL